VAREARISSLKRFKQDVTEVTAGLECGVGIEGSANLHVGDAIECYTKEKAS